MSQTRSVGCHSAAALRWLALANAFMYAAGPAFSLFLWSPSQSALVLVSGLLSLAVTLMGIRGIMRYKSTLVRPFVVLVWANTLMTVLVFVLAFVLVFMPSFQLMACTAITESKVVLFPVEFCLARFWKLAFVFLTTLAMATGFKVYMACVTWSFYRQLRDGKVGAPNDSYEVYTAVAKEEESEKV